jgi:hypothetical protein
MRLTTAALTALVAIANNAASSPQVINPLADGPSTPGGLRLVCALEQGGNLPNQYAASNATLAALITPASRIFTPPAGYGVMWMVLPANWIKTLFVGTGVSGPSDSLQISAECAVDCSAYWAAALTASGLFTAFANPAIFPLPQLTY